MLPSANAFVVSLFMNRIKPVMPIVMSVFQAIVQSFVPMVGARRVGHRG